MVPWYGRLPGGLPVIHVSRLHGAGSIVINADLIETVEACPDTHITLVTRRKFVVEDSLESVVEKVLEYRRTVVTNSAPATINELDEAA